MLDELFCSICPIKQVCPFSQLRHTLNEMRSCLHQLVSHIKKPRWCCFVISTNSTQGLRSAHVTSLIVPQRQDFWRCSRVASPAASPEWFAIFAPSWLDILLSRCLETPCDASASCPNLGSDTLLPTKPSSSWRYSAFLVLVLLNEFAHCFSLFFCVVHACLCHELKHCVHAH